MLVWLDSFELLAPRIAESAETLTDVTAATRDPLNTPKMPGFPSEEVGPSPAPKRRRRSAGAKATADKPRARASGDAPA